MLKKKITFQISQLKSLLGSEHNCVTVVNNFRGKLALLPFHLGYLKHAVKELLNARVSKYDPELNGIVLGHSNIKVMNYLGHSDSCVIHLNYLADIYLFTPIVGKNLSGVVNKKSKEYMGCLIHGTFNASIPKPTRVGDQLSIWLRTHTSVQIGTQLDFTVSKVDFSSRVPYIRGTIVRKEWDEAEEEGDSGFSCLESVEEAAKGEKKKKKKSKEVLSVKVEPEQSDDITYHDPDKISELLKGTGAPVKGKRKKWGEDDSGLSPPPVPVKKIKKEKMSPVRDVAETEVNQIPVEIKKERSSVTPTRSTSPPPSGKKSKKHLQVKVKTEPSNDRPISPLVHQAEENPADEPPSCLDPQKKKRKNKSLGQSEETIGIERRDSTSVAADCFERKEEELPSSVKKSRKRKTSSPVNSESDDSSTNRPKRKKSKRNSVDKLASSLLAETIARLK